jgi:hypothetical protein
MKSQVAVYYWYQISSWTGPIVIDGAPYSEPSAGDIDLGQRRKQNEETGSPSVTLREERLMNKALRVNEGIADLLHIFCAQYFCY